ncbi:MAG: M24 family metallopeptidase, partial [Phycisphaerae bacterium]
MDPVISEKLDQAVGILDEFDIDAWLIFVRETSQAPDPVLPLLLGVPLTWQSALILTRGGRRIALVGRFDEQPVRSVGGWREVAGYVEGIAAPLRELLRQIDPRRLAVNFSRDDVSADGLSHGMWLILQDYLEGTPFADRIEPAERVIAALRGRKSPTEIERIRAAIQTTEEMFEEVGRFLAPGRTEREVADFMQASVKRRGLGFAWDPDGCPIVNTGPASAVGHSRPTDLRIAPGHVVHIDFGVKQDGFCADLQRNWYVPSHDHSGPPVALQRAFEAVSTAIENAARALRPGVPGWQVDEA